MLNAKAARVKGIVDKALGPVLDVSLRESSPRSKTKVSKFSLKFFTRDDSMLCKPESIKASVDREVRRIRMKEKQVLMGQQAVLQQRPRTKKQPAQAHNTSQEWILRDDLDDP